MNNRTATVTLSASQDEVFAFLSDLRNLPSWATESCRSLRQESGHWKMSGPAGEFFVTLLACGKTGVIDFLSGENPDQLEVMPLRVMRLPHGCAVTCTLFQPADCTAELFDWRHDLLLRELRALATRFNGGELHGSTGATAPFYPGLVTARFYETWDFYTTHLGFKTVCECDAYVQLRHPAGAQLGIMRHEQAEHPALVPAVEGRGFWLGLDVADVDAEHARLVAAGVEVVSPPEDKPWGQRHFIVRDPNGVLISVAHRIPVGAVAEASYAGAF